MAAKIADGNDKLKEQVALWDSLANTGIDADPLKNLDPELAKKKSEDMWKAIYDTGGVFGWDAHWRGPIEEQLATLGELGGKAFKEKFDAIMAEGPKHTLSGKTESPEELVQRAIREANAAAPLGDVNTTSKKVTGELDAVNAAGIRLKATFTALHDKITQMGQSANEWVSSFAQAPTELDDTANAMMAFSSSAGAAVSILRNQAAAGAEAASAMVDVGTQAALAGAQEQLFADQSALANLQQSHSNAEYAKSLADINKRIAEASQTRQSGAAGEIDALDRQKQAIDLARKLEDINAAQARASVSQAGEDAFARGARVAEASAKAARARQDLDMDRQRDAVKQRVDAENRVQQVRDLNAQRNNLIAEHQYEMEVRNAQEKIANDQKILTAFQKAAQAEITEYQKNLTTLGQLIDQWADGSGKSAGQIMASQMFRGFVGSVGGSGLIGVLNVLTGHGGGGGPPLTRQDDYATRHGYASGGSFMIQRPTSIPGIGMVGETGPEPISIGPAFSYKASSQGGDTTLAATIQLTNQIDGRALARAVAIHMKAALMELDRRSSMVD